MASLSHRYPDLSASSPLTMSEVSESLDTLEDMKLASFEEGYQAGWEDAEKAQAVTADRAVIDAAQNLQDMSFSHHQAYLKLMESMQPLLTVMVDKLLPKIAWQLVGIHIVDLLTEMVKNHAESAIEIAVAPDDLDALRAQLSETVHLPFSLVAEAALSSGQAHLRVGLAEQDINLDAVLSGISEAIEAFYLQTKED